MIDKEVDNGVNPEIIFVCGFSQGCIEKNRPTFMIYSHTITEADLGD